MTSPGTLIVLTGPSGVGKGTLLKQLHQLCPDLYLAISATTRSPRAGEVEGQHYYFLTREQFQACIAQNQLLEWAEYAGNFYGTLREPVMDQIQQGHTVILEIELAGARQIRQKIPEAFQIFVRPPSVAALESRLRGRGQDAEAAIARRLDQAKIELAAADEFDFQLVNDDFDTALEQLKAKVLSL
ncbi:MAG: guanylate kinase [Acaryochloris sp. RU_4_1]|nr:guanylate kinase [Acaryochloris sp. RU_4_1]NJN38699.1 guanylate kinase [Acaryochloridaceae cyanobacterium CSU_3_4]NJR55890.1 guanylate kinase [Acaryochloris sp. CRU_2_0]